MRLTAEHVARLRRDIPDPGPQLVDGFRVATEADWDQNVSEMLASRPPGPFWLFGISSLIWKPETAFVEKRFATAHGWHRRFCLGWDYRFRGSRETPGLMMALHVWALSHGIASLFARGDAGRRTVPMPAEDLLEAAMLIYMRGLAAPKAGGEG
jgi:cation transport protein ChaC